MSIGLISKEATCPKDHPCVLLYTKPPGYGSNGLCDVCRKGLISSEGNFHCKICKYDLC